MAERKTLLMGMMKETYRKRVKIHSQPAMAKTAYRRLPVLTPQTIMTPQNNYTILRDRKPNLRVIRPPNHQ